MQLLCTNQVFWCREHLVQNVRSRPSTCTPLPYRQSRSASLIEFVTSSIVAVVGTDGTVTAQLLSACITIFTFSASAASLSSMLIAKAQALQGLRTCKSFISAINTWATAPHRHLCSSGKIVSPSTYAQLESHHLLDKWKFNIIHIKYWDG